MRGDRSKEECQKRVKQACIKTDLVKSASNPSCAKKRMKTFSPHYGSAIVFGLSHWLSCCLWCCLAAYCSMCDVLASRRCSIPSRQ